MDSLVLGERLLEFSLPEQLACQLEDKPVLMTLLSALINAILPRKEKSLAQIEDFEVLAGLVGFILREHCLALNAIIRPVSVKSIPALKSNLLVHG